MKDMVDSIKKAQTIFALDPSGPIVLQLKQNEQALPVIQIYCEQPATEERTNFLMSNLELAKNIEDTIK